MNQGATGWQLTDEMDGVLMLSDDRSGPYIYVQSPRRTGDDYTARIWEGTRNGNAPLFTGRYATAKDAKQGGLSESIALGFPAPHGA